MPPINFAYRAGSAENMSNGRLLMQKVWSETFPTDRRAANHSIGQALLPTNEISTACLYPSTPWLPLCLTGGLRKTEPGASAEASKRYPSTRTNRGGVCAAAMYKKVHDDGAYFRCKPTRVYGKRKPMRPCTCLPLYSDLFCKTASATEYACAPPASPCYARAPSSTVQNSWVTHTTHTHPPHHTCLDGISGETIYPSHKYGVLQR